MKHDWEETRGTKEALPVLRFESCDDPTVNNVPRKTFTALKIFTAE
jgi:hypothetical protein